MIDKGNSDVLNMLEEKLDDGTSGLMALKTAINNIDIGSGTSAVQESLIAIDNYLKNSIFVGLDDTNTKCGTLVSNVDMMMSTIADIKTLARASASNTDITEEIFTEQYPRYKMNYICHNFKLLTHGNSYNPLVEHGSVDYDFGKGELTILTSGTEPDSVKVSCDNEVTYTLVPNVPIKITYSGTMTIDAIGNSVYIYDEYFPSEMD